jgi:ParB family chromosome partitioning protein
VKLSEAQVLVSNCWLKQVGPRSNKLQAGIITVEEDPENDIKSVDDKNADKVVGNIIELEIEAIEINPFQPRSNFNEESLRGLLYP